MFLAPLPAVTRTADVATYRMPAADQRMLDQAWKGAAKIDNSPTVLTIWFRSNGRFTESVHRDSGTNLTVEGTYPVRLIPHSERSLDTSTWDGLLQPSSEDNYAGSKSRLTSRTLQETGVHSVWSDLDRRKVFELCASEMNDWPYFVVLVIQSLEPAC
jgi:hypothetical protein